MTIILAGKENAKISSAKEEISVYFQIINEFENMIEIQNERGERGCNGFSQRDLKMFDNICNKYNIRFIFTFVSLDDIISKEYMCF